MSVIHAPEERPLTLRQLVVLGSLFLALVGFAARLWQLQISQHDEMIEQAERTATRVVKTQAPRGRIFDRNGVLVAGVQPTWVVKAVPKLVTEEALTLAANILETTPKRLQKELNEAPYRSLPSPIFVGASFVQASRVAESRSLLPGFDVEMTAMRQAVEPDAYTHVLGYVGRVTREVKEELEKEGLEPGEYVGRDGVERTMEKALMGQPGDDRMAVDAKGRPVSVVSQTAPAPGSQLYLSIDDEIQKTAQKAMQGRKGALVLMDIHTGEVLAFVSSPTYSLRLFEGGIRSEDYAQLQADPAKPLIRRPSSGRYSPGSTFKIVTALAAARMGILDTDHFVHCDGGRKVGNRLVACKNHARGMSLNFREAFRLSCNTYFVDLALRAGPEALRKAATDLGLGQRTGIDLPFENKGFIPNGKSVKEISRERRWYPGDTANMGIGQGDTLVTPLQMATLVSIVAGDGVGHRPRLVHALKGPKDAQPVAFPPTEEIRVDAPPGFWALIREAMGHVIDAGTARRAQIAGLEWGGKTGSTQHSRSNRTHSWFVGLAPLHDPQVAVAVLAEEAGHGGDVAAPIAAQAVADWHQLRVRREERAVAMASRSSDSP